MLSAPEYFSQMCATKLSRKHPVEASQTHDGRLPSEAAAGVMCTLYVATIRTFPEKLQQ